MSLLSPQPILVAGPPHPLDSGDVEDALGVSVHPGRCRVSFPQADLLPLSDDVQTLVSFASQSRSSELLNFPAETVNRSLMRSRPFFHELFSRLLLHLIPKENRDKVLVVIPCYF